MVAGSNLISVFLIYAPPPFRDASGTFIYGVFRSREPSGAFTGRLRCPEGQKSTGGAPGGWARHPCSFLLRDSICVVSKLRIVISWNIMILEKSPVNFSLYRSLKLKKYIKQGFPVLQSQNQNKGDPLENPQKTIKNMDIMLYDANTDECVAINYKVHVFILHASTSPSLTPARPKYEGDKTRHGLWSLLHSSITNSNA